MNTEVLWPSSLLLLLPSKCPLLYCSLHTSLLPFVVVLYSPLPLVAAAVRKTARAGCCTTNALKTLFFGDLWSYVHLWIWVETSSHEMKIKGGCGWICGLAFVYVCECVICVCNTPVKHVYCKVLALQTHRWFVFQSPHVIQRNHLKESKRQRVWQAPLSTLIPAWLTSYLPTTLGVWAGPGSGGWVVELVDVEALWLVPEEKQGR